MGRNICAERAAAMAARGRGLTIVELLVCIVIIAMLLGLLAPSLAAARKAGQNTTCLAHLRDLSLTTVLYADAYKCLPVWDTVSAVPMLDLPRGAWWCAADQDRTKDGRDSSYGYLALLYMGPSPNLSRPESVQAWRALPAYEANPYLPLFRETFPWHGHRNMAFWNGTATRWED
jgi:type II secretory pathway pseudopilin PulG